MPSPDLKTSIGSFESLSTLSTSQPPEPLCPLKHPSHPPHAGTLLPNPTTSVESLGSLPSLSSSRPPEPLRLLKHPSHKPCRRSTPRHRNPSWASWSDSTQADSQTDATTCPMCSAPERSCLHSRWVPLPSSARVIRGVGCCSDPDLDLSWSQEAARAWCLCTSSQCPFQCPNLPTHLPKASLEGDPTCRQGKAGVPLSSAWTCQSCWTHKAPKSQTPP
nr:putative uncharacterized protein FLJ35723 [Saimiri boliviensis boliviensis]